MAEAHSPLAQFEIKTLADIHLGGIDASFTNASLIMVVVVALVTLFIVKNESILQNAKISILIDNRENLSSDIKNAIAVTVVGNASEIKDGRQHFMDIHLKKHPYFNAFLLDSNCALIGLSVKKISIVSQFVNFNK